MKFTDKYEVTAFETRASDANTPEPDNPRPPHTNRTAECVGNDGTPFPEGTDMTFSIIDGDTGLFSIDPVTGLFTVSESYPFDYEQQPFYIVTIQCNLTSDPSQYGNGIVNISIGPVNEYKPIIIAPGPILLPETTPRGKIIAAPNDPSEALGTYTASDRDRGPDGVIAYSFNFMNGNDKLFDGNEETGIITLNDDLDFDTPEGTQVPNVKIVVCNSGLELEICETRQLTIFLTPANDILPEFNATSYSASLNDSASNGTLVAQVLCVDRDKVVGGVQDISFGDEESNVTLSTFKIDFDSTTGSAEVSLLSELDHETIMSYTFTLVCSDGNNIATAKVTVEVLPVNDNMPQFEKDRYEFSVNRAAPVPSDTIAGRVRATDADKGVGGIVAYFLTSDKFAIDSETGEISLKDYLSAGDGSTFDFDVIASDGEYETKVAVRVTAKGLLSILEWVYVGIAAFVLLVIAVIIGIIVFHHFIKAASLKTIVKETYIE